MSLRAIHVQFFNPPTKIAAIGSGCSIATEASAEVSHFYNITQVGARYIMHELVIMPVNNIYTYQLLLLSITSDLSYIVDLVFC